MRSWPRGYGRRVLEEVDSTNAEAARIAPDLAGPEWILALRQTAGRGRRGRVWIEPEGNFAATLVMRPPGEPETVALRSFVAALAVYDAVVAVTGRTAGMTLKWPNDVLLNGGKLAGILLESSGQAGGLSHLAIGIGVNLAGVPGAHEVERDAFRPVSLLSESGVRVMPGEFLDALAPAYAEHEVLFATYGFAPIRRAWLERAAKLGLEITARTATETTTGQFETVDAGGNLVLSKPDGRNVIRAAEVFF